MIDSVSFPSWDEIQKKSTNTNNVTMTSKPLYECGNWVIVRTWDNEKLKNY